MVMAGGRRGEGATEVRWPLSGYGPRRLRGEGWIEMKREWRKAGEPDLVLHMIYLPGERESGGDLCVDICI